jgi:predicted DNA-binding transcriptional regulator YafY
LSNNELAAIVTALQGISSTYANINHQILLDKLKSSVPQSHLHEFNLKTQQIFIDLSMWGKNEFLEAKIEKLKTAIEQSNAVILDYCNIKGEITLREVEPYTLILKGQKWYLYAYCKKRNGFRLFKLSRIREIKVTGTVFERGEINLKDLPWNTDWRSPEKTVNLKLLFDDEVKTVVEEWFGIENVNPEPDGKYVVKASLPEESWLYGFILSFGNHVEVIEPECFRETIGKIAESIYKIYKK